MKANAVRYLLALFFLFPFLVLFYFFRIKFDYDIKEIFWALKNSLAQSFATAFLSVFFGFFGALGLFKVKNRFQQLLKFLILFPVFLPSLFTVLIGVSILYFMPLGSLGIIYFLTLIYLGFSVSVIHEELNSQLGQLGFVADVYGVSKAAFFFRILLPLAKKSIGYTFVIVFVNAMTAFTIPLIVGAGRGTNLEVLIYEKIFIEQNWSSAAGLGLLQLTLIAVLAYFLQTRPVVSLREYKESRLVGSWIGLAGLLFYLWHYFSGYIKLTWEWQDSYYLAEVFNSGLVLAMYQSLILFVFCLAVFSALMLAVLYLKYSQKEFSYLNFFLNPSSVLVGFSFYLVMPSQGLFFSMLKVSLVMGAVAFVGFMKFVFENQMQLFENQVKVARTFGIDFFSFVFKIYFPQIKRRLHFAFSFLFIFVISEFGLVKASGAEIKTLGTEMASYLWSYRMEGASIISFLILGLWLVATIISGALLGIHKKS